MGTNRSIGIIGILNIIGGFVGLANTIVTAYYFGTSRQLEVYFAAVQLEQLLLSLTQGGQLVEIYLPIYLQLKINKSIEFAHRTFSVILNWLMLIFILISIGLWFGAYYIFQLLVPGFETTDHILGMWMFRAVIPLMFMRIIISMLHSIANAEKLFGRPELVGILSRISIVLVIAVFSHIIGIWAMVLALATGTLISLIGLIYILSKQKIKYYLVLKQKGFDFKDLVKKVLSTYVYVGTTQFYSFVLNAMVSFLPQGSYAVFNYVKTLHQKTRPIIIKPISIVFFTNFSIAFAKGAKEVKRLAQIALSQTFGIVILAIVAIIISGDNLLYVIWGRDKFGAEELYLAYRLLVIYFFVDFILGYAVITRRMVVSIGYPHLFYYFLSIMQFLSAGATYIFIKQFGFLGLMFLVVFNSLGFCLIPLIVLKLKAKDLLVFYPLETIWKWVLSGCIALLIGFQFKTLMVKLIEFDGRIGTLLYSFLVVMVTWSIAILLGYLLRIPEVKKGIAYLKVKAVI